jgi:anti-sigma B factor antagonist
VPTQRKEEIMGFATEESDGRIRFKIQGALSIYKVLDLRDALLSCLEDDSALEVDLEGVTECDAAGLQLLVAAHRTADQQKRNFHINGASSVILQTLSGLGLDLGDMIKGVEETTGSEELG